MIWLAAVALAATTAVLLGAFGPYTPALAWGCWGWTLFVFLVIAAFPGRRR